MFIINRVMITLLVTLSHFSMLSYMSFAMLGFPCTSYTWPMWNLVISDSGGERLRPRCKWNLYNKRNINKGIFSVGRD